MDKSRYGGRPFHGVRQPDVQRNLRALSGRTDEQQQTNRRQRAEVRRLHRHRRRGVGDVSKIESAERVERQEYAEDEAPVADAVHDERLLAGVRRALLLVPIPNQQIRTQAHAFPPDKHREERAAEHEREHEKAEQIQVAEKSRVRAARLVHHVRGRVHVDEEADSGDDQNHHPRKRIEPERPRHLKRAEAVRRGPRNRRNPTRNRHHVLARFGRQAEHLPERVERQAEGAGHCGAGQQARRALAERPDPDQPVQQRPQRR